MSTIKEYTVLEFYSGIGGMHMALQKTNIQYKVIGAIDINDTANKVYKFNFPATKVMQRNIESFTANELDLLNADIWTISPPCQPYTRQGNQNHSKDPRSNSFAEVLKSLQKMLKPPSYIFIENVKGFEESDMREVLVETLQMKKFYFQEILISPKHIGIPNSRLRYYMIAKLKPFIFAPTNNILKMDEEDINNSDGKLIEILTKESLKKNRIADLISKIKESNLSIYKLDEKKLLRFYPIFDIVTDDSFNSCCFTKAYSQLVKGAGSIYSPLSTTDIDHAYLEIMSSETNDEERLKQLKSLQLRHFTPLEACALMGFPDTFSFPETLKMKQKYQLIGNSINVDVVSMLMARLLFELK